MQAFPSSGEPFEELPDKPKPAQPQPPKQTTAAPATFTAGEIAAILKISQSCCDVEKGPSLLECVTTQAKHSTDPRQRRRAMLVLLCGSLTNEETFRQVAAVLRFENVISGDMPFFQDGWKFPTSFENATRGEADLRDLAMTALTAAARLPESTLRQLAFSSDGESIATDSDGDAMQFSADGFAGYSQSGAAELSPAMAKLLNDRLEQRHRNPNFNLRDQAAAQKQVDQLVASGLRL